jgi:hypothetical protein
MYCGDLEPCRPAVSEECHPPLLDVTALPSADEGEPAVAQPGEQPDEQPDPVRVVDVD